MADAFTETPAERAEDRLSLIAAILLGIAATLTAVSAYEAALLDGEVLEKYSEANAALTASTFVLTTDLKSLSEDQVIFREYASANFENNTDLSEYIYDQMTPNLQEAVDWWIETDEAVTPFEDGEGNPYTGTDLTEGTDLVDQSDTISNEAAAADKKGDKFELASVLLALTLFFAGIATLFARRRFTITLLTFGAVALVAGTGTLITAFAA